eukprot:gene31684-6887_t
MKSGDMLLLNVKTGTADFTNIYCSKDSFPLESFNYEKVTQPEFLETIFKQKHS